MTFLGIITTRNVISAERLVILPEFVITTTVTLDLIIKLATAVVVTAILNVTAQKVKNAIIVVDRVILVENVMKRRVQKSAITAIRKVISAEIVQKWMRGN